jgi:hypothetical protein
MARYSLPHGLCVAFVATLVPAVTFAQISAGEAERCFQNPAGCNSAGGGAAPGAAAPRQYAPPDYTSVLQSPEPDRRKIQESLRTLDKYNGPIDGNLQSDQTMKAITEWQRGHGYAQVGKLTPTEAQTLNAEAARAPIKRIDPSQQQPQQAAATSQPTTSNADLLKSLQQKLAARRKAAEPKAEAAAEALARDLKAYVAADGKGAAGDQFPDFAKWYAGTKTAGRKVGEITTKPEDYGETSSGTGASAEVHFETKQDSKVYQECMVFAWVEANPRKNPKALHCDDVAGLEKWKTDLSLRSDWR